MSPMFITTPRISQGCQKKINNNNEKIAVVPARLCQIWLNPGTPKPPKPARTKPAIEIITNILPIF